MHIRTVFTETSRAYTRHTTEQGYPTAGAAVYVQCHCWGPGRIKCARIVRESSWGAVCTDDLSIEILDALFLAGADNSLYTASHHGTPLHCLARKALDPVGDMQVSHLHAFVKHLVSDLRAPLSAQDDNGDTCIHVAAEHGQSLEVLLALLSCDSRGVIREIKNCKGCASNLSSDRYNILTGLQSHCLGGRQT